MFFINFYYKFILGIYIIMDEIYKTYGFALGYNNYDNILIDVFNNNNLTYDINDDKITNIYGLYYQYKIKNYIEMKKFYKLSIDKNNSDAMFNLGFYYQGIGENNVLMKKYYLMAIELKHVNAMLLLGDFYLFEKNYTEMKKYFKMAIDNGNKEAIIDLALYFKNNEKNYFEMKKYLSFDLNNPKVINILDDCYENIEKDYNELQKYYIDKIKKINDNIILDNGHNQIKNLNNYDIIDICYDNTEIKLLSFCNKIYTNLNSNFLIDNSTRNDIIYKSLLNNNNYTKELFYNKLYDFYKLIFTYSTNNEHINFTIYCICNNNYDLNNVDFIKVEYFNNITFFGCNIHGKKNNGVDIPINDVSKTNFYVNEINNFISFNDLTNIKISQINNKLKINDVKYQQFYDDSLNFTLYKNFNYFSLKNNSSEHVIFENIKNNIDLEIFMYERTKHLTLYGNKTNTINFSKYLKLEILEINNCIVSQDLLYQYINVMSNLKIIIINMCDGIDENYNNIIDLCKLKGIKLFTIL